MSRWRFLLGLLGVGAGAQVTTGGCAPLFQDESYRKPCNGQCPVCKWNLPRWKVTEGEMLVTHNESPGLIKSGLALPPPRVARCPRCSAAFWQDPEEA